MNNPIEARAITTIIMWIASMTGVVLLSNNFTPNTNGFAVIVLGILMILIVLGTIAGTLAIWTSLKESTKREAAQQAARTVEKSKRTEREQAERVKRLVEMLDEDEIAYLEARAKQMSVGDDGELVEANQARR